jgi:ribose transport system ATP-binding protein
VQTPLVELRRVSRSFGATRALSDVSFDVRPGEVHVLAGENGAGKSTLIRILSGDIPDFDGAMLVSGKSVRLRDARDAARHGIAAIHQELSLVGSMTVADNLSLARPGAFFGWVSAAAQVRAARAILAEMELDVDPLRLVETLPLAAQQLLEIARALAQHARVLVLDEPTSALTEADAERLLARVQRLAESGCGIVYISHRMEENDRLAHRITVLRDGRVVAARAAKDLAREELVALMMGRDNSAPDNAPDSAAATEQDSPPAHDLAKETPLLDVRDLHAASPGASPLHGVSFSVARGEIVGLAGLRGSGTSETLAALFGVFGKLPAADVWLDGARFTLESPARSIAQGLLFLANDRKKTVLHDLDVTENVTLSSLSRIAPYGVVALQREARIARAMTARLRVAAPSLRAPLRALSGGNQQKVALLRCLATEPRVLLLDEPTRGVDIGAKADIHRTLRALAAGGKGIVLVASEIEELTGLCDRVCVLTRGRVTEVLAKADFSPQRLRLALDDPGALHDNAAAG